METEDLDYFEDISKNCDSNETNSSCFKKHSTKRYRPSPKRLLPPLRPIDFEQYVKINCEEKFKILNRTTFHQIEKPVIIFFNHFREKCAYHTKCLEKLYQLAQKYGDRIEFIAGDILDIDVMNSNWHSINFFCRIGNPEKVAALIYAIDEEKRIYEYSCADKTQESLLKLCDNLLKGNLFITQQLPITNNPSLVKVCVYQNYNQLVTNSSNHVLLIVGLDDYSDSELNFETVAEELKSYNIDVVYINAEKNYIPFELGISTYPSLLIIPKDDKTKYIEPFNFPHTEENIIECVKAYFNENHLFWEKKILELRKSSYQPFNIKDDVEIDFHDLPQYLQENCQHHLKIFDRQAFQRANRFVIIAFLNFENGKCIAQHLKWIDTIYQVSANLSSPREYFIADLKDIDVINPLWEPTEFRKHVHNKCEAPKIFGIDLNKNKFVLKDFQNAASLFYFAYSLTNGELYISEQWPNMNEEKLVKTCIADGLNLSITSVKKHILLVIYYSNPGNNTEFFELLEEIARELEKCPLKIMKIDSRLNCISLELDNSMYPIIYFIPQSDKNKRIRFLSDKCCKQDILEFIKQNM